MPAQQVGIDIGGAHLKYAHSDGAVHTTEFPLWQRPQELKGQLRQDLSRFADFDTIGVVMTGELADCFLNRAEGVRHIVDHVEQALAETPAASACYYCVDGSFLSAAEAKRKPDAVAAANWHAMANFSASQITSDGVLIDIGSTTADIIPLRNGRVGTDSRSDFDRLSAGELVYVGGRRTPVCSIVDELCYNGRPIPVMRELFATIDDARLLLGWEFEDAASNATADGKPRDRFHAANRIARMIGLDHQSVTIESAIELSEQIHCRARNLIASATSIDTTSHVVLCGHADDLATDLIGAAKCTRLSQRLGPDVARVGPAFALLKLMT